MIALTEHRSRRTSFPCVAIATAKPQSSTHTTHPPPTHRARSARPTAKGYREAGLAGPAEAPLPVLPPGEPRGSEGKWGIPAASDTKPCMSCSDMSQRRAWLGVLAIAGVSVICAACGVGPKTTSPRRVAAPITSKTHARLVVGGFTVVPSSGLQDGQQVTVTVKGLPRSRKFFLSECLSPTDANAVGCGQQLAEQPFGLTTGNGSGSTSFSVQASASAGPLVLTSQSCTGECVIVATSGVRGAFYFAPISFSPPAISSLGSIVCLAPENCLAAGTTTSARTTVAIATTTSNGGASWSATTLPSGMVFGSVSCASVQFCAVVGGTPVGNNYRGLAATSSDGGQGWTASPPLPSAVGELSEVSCPTVAFCMAVGASPDGSTGVALMKSSTQSWTVLPVPAGQKSLVLVACATASRCVVVGGPPSDTQSTVLVTSDGGASWTQSMLPQQPSSLVGPVTAQGISCPSTQECFVVGSETPGDGSPSGSVFATDDGGLRWTSQTLPVTTTSLLGISCPSASDCMAVGGGIPPRGGPGQAMIVTTTDGGNDWVLRPAPSGVSGLSSISCPTFDNCTAVGTGPAGPMVAYSSDLVATWSASTPSAS